MGTLLLSPPRTVRRPLHWAQILLWVGWCQGVKGQGALVAPGTRLLQLPAIHLGFTASESSCLSLSGGQVRSCLISPVCPLLLFHSKTHPSPWQNAVRSREEKNIVFCSYQDCFLVVFLGGHILVVTGCNLVDYCALLWERFLQHNPCSQL